MKNRLKILILLLLLNFTILSQVDTNKICFDYDIILEISKDLLRYDSVSLELEYTKKILKITETRSELKDKQIHTLLNKNINYGLMVEAYEKKDSICKKREQDLVNENTELTRKNKNLKISTLVLSSTNIILAGILAIFIIK